MTLDRRVLYTRKVIKEALYSLLQNSTLEQITVKEICAEADINRATFYRNYKDIFDLYETLESEMVQSAFPNGLKGNDLSKLLYVIYENQVFYKEFFRSRLDSPYIRNTIQEMCNETLQLVRNSAGYNEQTFQISFQYMLYGMLGVLREWVDGGCMENPNTLNSVLAKIIENQFQ